MPDQTKKAKVAAQANWQKGSRLYTAYRALGYIASGIPHSIQYIGQKISLTTGIGHSFHIYDGDTLNLLFVGPRFEHEVDSVISIEDRTYASTGGEVAVCQRAKRIGSLEPLDKSRGSVSSLTQLGAFILGLSEGGTLAVWKKNRELFTEIEFGESFVPTCIVHPSTYVNKVVVGDSRGSMQLWNIQARTCLHQFKSFGSAITCMAQSPVIDVIAVGLLDGRVVLHNVRQDTTLMEFSQQGRVTAVSFRTDNEAATMASANADGDIALWDLDERRLVHVMQGAHDAAVAQIDFVAGQALLVSSSSDNSVKEWVFDSLDGVPRLLRQRSGHFATPQYIRYYGDSGTAILSAGRDRALRYFSTAHALKSIELSQGSLQREARLRRRRMADLRMPAVAQFAASTARARDWDNLITCHRGDSNAYTWSVERLALGKYTLASADGSAVRAVAMSACGNFGVLGLASGQIELVNVQSGYSRRTFIGHAKAVTGVACDSRNAFVYSTSLDGTLRAWDFATGKQHACVTLAAAPAALEMHSESGLVACICDDASVRVLDCETLRVVRRFAGHRNRITDLAFSPDGRWIVTGSLDSTVCTWDVPTGYLVDCFRVESVPVSLAFSPTGDFLATAHIDSVGIFLWANRTQFDEVTLRNIKPAAGQIEIPPLVALPTTNDDVEADDTASDEQTDAAVYLTPEKLADGMVTLSSQPKSKWQTLLSLSTIKKRNKPEAAPRAPERAPFFLPTAEGVEHRFDISAERSNDTPDGDKNNDDPDTRSRVISTASVVSTLARALDAADKRQDYSGVFEYLAKLNPSAIDVEIRTLPLDNDLQSLRAFMRALIAQLKTKRDFELVQAYMQVFLGVFSDVLKESSQEVRDLVVELRDQSKAQWADVDALIRYSSCMVEFMRTSR